MAICIATSDLIRKLDDFEGFWNLRYEPIETGYFGMGSGRYYLLYRNNYCELNPTLRAHDI